MLTDLVSSTINRPDAVVFGKVLLCITEDWFAVSHFKPLIRALVGLAREVVVVTRASGATGEITALGARVRDFDFHRSSLNIAREYATAMALRRVISEENPDVVHLIAMKPIVLGSFALRGQHVQPVVVHVTGLGLIGISSSPLRRLVRRQAFFAMARLVQHEHAHLLLENPGDLDLLRAQGITPGDRWTILGGAGVDPEFFPELAPPDNKVPVAAHVGRMIYSKGVDTLLTAVKIVRDRGVDLSLDLNGKVDAGNPDALDPDELQSLTAKDVARWHGHVTDVRDIWRRSDIFVLASRGGEGLPRALLEAAACGRPLVVTDVPGCRHFVRDGVEGLVVPPDDPAALAAALTRLATNRDLRLSMGAAARTRVLAGYTEAHLIATVQAVYRALRSRCGR
jgi:glycosyltransferase involved in cell wall biosynthesis